MRDSICKVVEADRRVVAILQARMGSSRLPGKVLASVIGQPMLALIVKRVLPARYINQLVVATTQLPQDDLIEALVKDLGIPCFRVVSLFCVDDIRGHDLFCSYRIERS